MLEGKLVFPDTYNHNFACGNCLYSVGLKIPMGVTVQNYAHSHECPNCGCKLMCQKDNQQYNHPVKMPVFYLPFTLWREQQ